MGAIFVDYTFDASDDKTLVAEFNNCVSDSRYENGHGAYSGNLTHGIQIISTKFKDLDAASDWVANNQKKWGPAFAVRMGDFSKAFFNTAKGKKLLTQVSELQSSIQNYDKDLLKKLAVQKSLYKTCACCGSKISVKHFVKGNQTNCPVCSSDFVKSQKDHDKLKKMNELFRQKQSELKIAKDAHDKKLNKNKPFWYVGGWAAT